MQIITKDEADKNNREREEWFENLIGENEQVFDIEIESTTTFTL